MLIPARAARSSGWQVLFKMGKFIIVLLVAALAVFIYLHEQISATRLSYKVAELKTQYSMLNTENDLMRLKINSMLALEKLDKAAKESGLSKPDETRIRYID